MPEDATLDAFASSDASDGESNSDDETVETDPESEAVESSAADGSEADSADSSGVGSADDSADDSTDDSVDDSTGDSGNDPTESAGESAEVDVSDVDPARSTYEWTPDGGECADCGASAERRWRADGRRDGGLVCADCKEW